MIAVVTDRIADDLERVGQFGRFIWRAIVVSFISCFRPATYPLVWTQMYFIGVRSVPVIMITGAFVGMTLAVQTFDQLASLGFEERLGALINISGVKELGLSLLPLCWQGESAGH